MQTGRQIANLLLAMVMGATLVSCNAAPKLGGQSIGQAFPDTQAAALVRAGASGDEAEVALLMRQGADFNAIGDNGATPLMWALHARNHRGVEALLKAGADPNMMTEKVPMSPMNFVPLGDDPELLRLLLKYGGNPNHPGIGRISDRPLSAAASQGKIENMKLLLEAGADINAHDKFNESAATKTVALAKFEATAFLLDHGYVFNLSYLARRVKGRVVPNDSEAKAWQDKVVEMLDTRLAHKK